MLPVGVRSSPELHRAVIVELIVNNIFFLRFAPYTGPRSIVSTLLKSACSEQNQRGAGVEGRTIISSWPELEMTCACSKEEDQHCSYRLEMSMFSIAVPLAEEFSRKHYPHAPLRE